VRADAAELVDAGKAAENHMVADFNVPGEGGVVGKNAVVPDLAVVGDMHVGEQPVVIADAGHAAATAGAAIDGDKFADGVAVADDELRALAREFLVLRLAANRGMAEDAVVFADAGRAVDAAMRADVRACANLDFGADDAECADFDAFA